MADLQSAALATWLRRLRAYGRRIQEGSVCSANLTYSDPAEKVIDSFLRKVETNVEDSPVEVAVRAKNYKACRGEEVGVFLIHVEHQLR